jgi:hypothetical protein
MTNEGSLLQSARGSQVRLQHGERKHRSALRQAAES